MSSMHFVILILPASLLHQVPEPAAKSHELQLHSCPTCPLKTAPRGLHVSDQATPVALLQSLFCPLLRIVVTTDDCLSIHPRREVRHFETLLLRRIGKDRCL